MSEVQHDEQLGHKLLELYERELVSSLLEVKLSEISQKLLENDVFSLYESEIFSSLDYDRLDPKLCVRYFLHQLYDSLCEVEHDASKWEGFIDVLLSLGGSAEVMGLKLKEAKQPMELLEGTEPDHRDVELKLLHEKDIGKLMDVLSKYDYEWEGICIALKLPRNVREECRTGSNNTIRLTNVLDNWIVRNYSHAEPATLLILQRALCSQIVNCGKAAIELNHVNLFEVDSYQAISKSSSSSLKILHQSCNTEVKFGKSTLIEFQVSSGQSKSISYQWMKDGKCFNSSRYGRTSGILCIKEATNSGRYSCCVQVGNQLIKSNDIILKVLLPQKDEYLTSKYRKLREIPCDSWPPVSTSTFISLALIKQDKNTSFKHTPSTSIDDILASKEVFEYKSLFGTYTSGDLLFVEGRPGSGKTTLVHKITRDWASIGSALKGASMVYLIPLRLLNKTKKDADLFDILRIFYVDKDDTKKALRKIKDSMGDGICFILDGLDEYYGNGHEKQNVIQDLIYKCHLPLAMVIVASRPIGTAIHRNKANVNKRIEVIGFTGENIYEYVKSYPFDDPSSASKLNAHLGAYKNILHMCYLPVHAAMICYLYNTESKEIPHTETKVYEYFTKVTIVRGLKRDSSRPTNFDSLDHLDGEIKYHFDTICKLALEMIKNFKQVIDQKDKKALLDHAPGFDAPSLGLIVIDSTAKLYDDEDMYTFLHLTFQEFLAAYHISRLQGIEQETEEISLLITHKQYQVIKFYFGLIDIEKNICQLN